MVSRRRRSTNSRPAPPVLSRAVPSRGDLTRRALSIGAARCSARNRAKLECVFGRRASRPARRPTSACPVCRWPAGGAGPWPSLPHHCAPPNRARRSSGLLPFSYCLCCPLPGAAAGSRYFLYNRWEAGGGWSAGMPAAAGAARRSRTEHTRFVTTSPSREVDKYTYILETCRRVCIPRSLIRFWSKSREGISTKNKGLRKSPTRVQS